MPLNRALLRQAILAGDLDPRALSLDRDWLRALLADEPQAVIHPHTERAVARRAGAVAVVPVTGMITARRGFLERYGLAMSTETIGANIAAAVASPDIKAMVLDMNSPGGSVLGVTELHATIVGLRGSKPIVAQVHHLAASAAYWIASAADEIVATPSSLVGSIGVFAMHEDVSAALEQEGVKVTFISSTPEKVDGNPFEPLSDSGRAEIKAQVDQAYTAFVADVARGRGVSPATVRETYGRGHIVTAHAALAAGMVDKMRTLADTLAAYGVTAAAGLEEGRRGGAMARRRRELDLLEF